MTQSWKAYIRPLVPASLYRHYVSWRIRQMYAQQRKNLLAKYGRYAEFSLPERSLSSLFPTIQAEQITLPVSQIERTDEWEVPINEILALAAITRQLKPRRIFEIGTYLGSSTLVMAHNCPDDAQLTTLDLDPATRDAYLLALGYNKSPQYTPGERFMNTSVAAKVQQVYGASITFDFEPYYGQMDLVLVDADHSYDFVKADTAIALKLLRPGGVIIWDDYTWNDRHPECVGVTRYLNELAETKPIARIAHTRMGIYLDAPST